ncbi:TetR family transcriptional regulator, partial [Pseudomonas putida S11]
MFAEKGYGATSMGDIAEQAELPRSNLHYYFSTKDDLFRAVLQDLLDVWKQDALCFENFDDPRVVLTSYIRAKMGHSRSRPLGSKIWAEEMLHGAPVLGVNLDESLVPWAKLKEAKIRRWVEEGRILPVEPSATFVHDLGLDPALCRLWLPGDVAQWAGRRCRTWSFRKCRADGDQRDLAG